jgi:N-acetylmuramoyl-L-alanine amidase
LHIAGKPGTIRNLRVNGNLVRQIRVAETKTDVSRIVIDLASPSDHTVSQLSNPHRLMIEVRAAADKPFLTPLAPEPKPGVPPPLPISESKQPVEEVKPAAAGEVRQPPVLVAGKTTSVAPPPSSIIVAPSPRPVIDPEEPALRAPEPGSPGKSATAKQTAPPPPVREGPTAVPALGDSKGERSLTRALGLKLGRVVLDPGHGGHDHGTTGPGGLTEKDLVLDVALRLGKLIESRLNSEVVYTRGDDTFIPLEERTAIANKSRADLFLSIHANSSPYSNAAGVESYYLNFTGSKMDLEVAARENAGHDKSIYELSDLIQNIARHEKREESREFATKVQSSLFAVASKSNSAAKNRGVKKAPFVVLIGASMPSVLTEIGFVTNRREENLLKRQEHRQKIAEALFRGIADYASTLSHIAVAQRSGTEDAKSAGRASER